MQSNQLSRLARAALLVALSVILGRFFSFNTPIQKIGLGWLPVLLAGFLYGPFWGFAVGAAADFIGATLFPFGPYFVGFTISAGISGAILPLVLNQKKRWRGGYWQLFGAVLLSEFITSVVINTYWLTIITGKTALMLLPIRILNAAVMVPLMTTLLILVRRQMRSYLPRVIE